MTNRVKVALRVGEKVLSAYNEEIERKYGNTRPYGGVELERELRTELDENDLSTIRNTVSEMRDDLDAGGHKKEISDKPDRSETKIVQYRISEEIRERIKKLAQQSDIRSAGEFIGSVMWRYVVDGGVTGEISRDLEKIQEATQNDRTDADPVERRTETIVNQLAGGGFTKDEFDQAVGQAKGISPGQHATGKYLPKVLERLDYTWHPNNPEIFVPEDKFDLPSHRDPRPKQYNLMTVADKRLSIKLAAYEKNPSHSKWRFTVEEGRDVLEGHPRKQTVRSLMASIADEGDNGYEFDPTDGELKIHPDEIKESDMHNEAVLNITEV